MVMNHSNYQEQKEKEREEREFRNKMNALASKNAELAESEIDNDTNKAIAYGVLAIYYQLKAKP